MGTLFYGAARTEIIVDDRLLRHLEIVATGKLRRGEGFLLSWIEVPQAKAARSAVWIHPQVDLYYDYTHNGVEVDRSLLEQLDTQADSNGGVRLNDGILVPNGRAASV